MPLSLFQNATGARERAGIPDREHWTKDDFRNHQSLAVHLFECAFGVDSESREFELRILGDSDERRHETRTDRAHKQMLRCPCWFRSFEFRRGVHTKRG